MNNQTEVRCPKCNSNQLTANKKGFSGVNAVGGALLTGGIGLLAGTIGSNKIIITCLACGHKFKAGEGKIITISQNQSQPTIDTIGQSTSTSNADPIDQRILEITRQKGKLAAVKFCKDARGWDLLTSKNYVDNLADLNGVMPEKKEGCFIATVCYGDYNSNEVLLLRNYRDNVLSQNTFGRLFIELYYKVSPTLANAIARSDKTKSFIRNYFLNHIVSKLGSKKNGK